MGILYEYFVAGVKNALEYKDQFLTELVGEIVTIGFFYVIWEMIYSKVKISMPLTLNEIIVYYALTAFVTQINNFRIDRFLQRAAKTGIISYYIVRPYNYIFAEISKEFGRYILNYSFTFIVFLIVAAFLHVGINVFVFFLYLPFVWVFFIETRVFFGILSFWVTEVWGLRFFYYSFQDLFSGSVLPLFLFPAVIFNALKFLPFPYLNYNLVMLTLGKQGSGLLQGILILVLWDTALLVFLYFFYKKSFFRLESLGG